MKRALAVIALLGVLWPLSASAGKLPPKTMTMHYVIAHDRLSVNLDGILKKAPKGEKWFSIYGGHGIAAFSTTPGGSPMVADTSTIFPDTQNMVATDVMSQGFLRDSVTGALVVTNGSSGTITLPYTAVAGGVGQTPQATSVVGIGVFNPNTGLVDMATGDANQNINVNVQVVTPTIKVIVVPNKQPYPTNTVLISQFDFAVNQATCTAVTSPSSYSGAVPNTGHYCWIIKATSGVLERVTWQSLNNMNTLVANTDVICYDNATTNTGSIVFQGSMGAGQFADFEPYGRPFVNGLVCIANHSVGTAAIDAMELEIL